MQSTQEIEERERERERERLGSTAILRYHFLDGVTTFSVQRLGVAISLELWHQLRQLGAYVSCQHHPMQPY